VCDGICFSWGGIGEGSHDVEEEVEEGYIKESISGVCAIWTELVDNCNSLGHDSSGMVNLLEMISVPKSGDRYAAL